MGEAMNYDELSEDLKARAREAKSTDELLALAEQEGIELSDEELASVSGGSSWSCDSNICSGYVPDLPPD